MAKYQDKEYSMLIKEFITASRYKGRELARLLALIYLIFTFILFFAPLIPAKIIDTPSSWLWYYSFFLSAYAMIGFFREYIHTRDYHFDSYKTKFIQNLLSLLIRCYEWQGHCRITLFRLMEKNGQSFVTPVERASAGSAPGFKGKKAMFEKNEGIPGKAWSNSWDGGSVNNLAQSIIIADIPGKVMNNEKELEKHYLKTFNLRPETFQTLSKEKYQIRSYMGIGILNNIDMSLSALIVIDSTRPNQFNEFLEIKKAASTSSTIIREEQGLYLSVEQNSEENSDDVPSISYDSDIFSKLDSFAKEITRSKKKDEDKLVQKLKTLYKLMAMETYERKEHQIDPPDIQAALLPLDWTLKCLRELLGKD